MKRHLDLADLPYAGLRHLFVFPHQDDEFQYAGLIQRCREHARFVWVTNGDGLAPGSGMTPEQYGALRMAEADRSLEILGVPPGRKTDLALSEIEIYRLMSALTKGAAVDEGMHAFFRQIPALLLQEMERHRPDCVWTVAWQGGHPEHDLVHFFTRAALERYRAGRSETVRFFHLPEYEFTILVPLRFKPWFDGLVHRIRLTDGEFAAKMRLADAYASQKELIEKFGRVVDGLGRLGRLVGRPFTFEDYGRVEEWAEVPGNLDYTRSTHLLDVFDYIREDFQGIPIGFKRSVRPIVRAFLERGF